MLRSWAFALCAAHSYAEDLSKLGWTLATANIGGGEPQPEFLGGDWQSKPGEMEADTKPSFGGFEIYLGATVLTVGFDCFSFWPKGVQEQYKDRYGTIAKLLKSCNDKPVQMSAADILGVDNLNTIAPVSFPKINSVFLETRNMNVQDWIYNEIWDGTKIGGAKTISGAEGFMKDRKAFPYLGEGFMELVEKAEINDKKTLSEFYLTKTEISSKIGDDGPQWPYVMLWDLLIVQTFVKWKKTLADKGFDSHARALAPNTIMADEVVGCKVKEITEHAWMTNDIVFIQELKGVKKFCESLIPLLAFGGHGGNGKSALCLKPTSDGEADTAILFNKNLNFKVLRDSTEEVEQLFKTKINDFKEYLEKNKPGKNRTEQKKHKYYQYVDAGKKKEFIDLYWKLEDDGKTYKTKKKFDKFTQTPKYTLAVGVFGRENEKEHQRMMLMSAHPDSDGLFCRLYLAIAKDIFNELKDPEMKLIIGMDTNIQSKDSTNFKQEIEEKFQYTVLWPGEATVNKQRTFLQSQLPKAAKFDKIRKDMLFIYPQETGQWNVDVYNNFVFSDGHYKPSYTDGQHPKDGWPMDHFMTHATPTQVEHARTANTHPGAGCTVSNNGKKMRTQTMSVQKLPRALRKIVHNMKRASKKWNSMRFKRNARKE